MLKLKAEVELAQERVKLELRLVFNKQPAFCALHFLEVVCADFVLFLFAFAV